MCVNSCFCIIALLSISTVKVVPPYMMMSKGEEPGRTYRIDVVICNDLASLDPIRCSFRLCARCLHNTSQVIQNQGAHMIRCYN